MENFGLRFFSAILLFLGAFISCTPKDSPIDPNLIKMEALLLPPMFAKGFRIVSTIEYNFDNPYAIAVDSQDNVYVAEKSWTCDVQHTYTGGCPLYVATTRSRVLKFDPSGKFLGWLGLDTTGTTGFHSTPTNAVAAFGLNPEEFTIIGGLATDAQDRLYVSDAYRIQRFDSSLNFEAWLGKASDNTIGWHTTGQPQGNPDATQDDGAMNTFGAISFYGNKIYAAEEVLYYVNRYDQSGTYEGWLGKDTNDVKGWHTPLAGVSYFRGTFHGNDIGAFDIAKDIAIDPTNGNLLVVDSVHDPVLSVWAPDGTYLNGIFHTGSTGTGEKPYAIAIDSFGNVIISDMYQGTIRGYNSSLQQKATLQVEPPSIPNVYYPIVGAKLTVASNGYLYAVHQTRNRILKIKILYSEW